MQSNTEFLLFYHSALLLHHTLHLMSYLISLIEETNLVIIGFSCYYAFLAHDLRKLDFNCRIYCFYVPGILSTLSSIYFFLLFILFSSPVEEQIIKNMIAQGVMFHELGWLGNQWKGDVSSRVQADPRHSWVLPWQMLLSWESTVPLDNRVLGNHSD